MKRLFTSLFLVAPAVLGFAQNVDVQPLPSVSQPLSQPAQLQSVTGQPQNGATHASAAAVQALRFGFTFYTIDILVLVSCLFTLSLIDLDTMTIPDRFIVIPAAFQLIYAFAYGGFASVWYCLWHALILGGAVLLLSLFMDKVLKKESMGGGDIKLLFLHQMFLRCF